MDKKAMFKLSNGMFVITATDGDKDNGCISNTPIQVTADPDRLSFCLNKTGCTHDMIMKTKVCTISVLSEMVPFALVKHFGFQSGKQVNKFAKFKACRRGANGVFYITQATNAFFSLKVTKTVDLGSYTMFIGEITDMEVLDEANSATYKYYLENIKPKSQGTETTAQEPTVWRCIICGHEYVGEELPEDFICPVCEHSAAYFRRVER